MDYTRLAQFGKFAESERCAKSNNLALATVAV